MALRCLVSPNDSEGHVVSFDGNSMLVLETLRAYPPGQPVRVAVSFDERAVVLQAKVIGSAQGAVGQYVVRVRLPNLRREDRDALRSHVATANH